MIRINLLPREEKAKSAPSMQFKAGELAIPVGLVAAVVVVIAGFAMSQRARVTRLTASIQEVETQSRALAPQIERVNRLARERAELDLRLGVISKLQKGRTVTVRLMDELARCVPDHLWLVDVDQEGAQLSIEGVTFSNLVVSDFMSRVERSAMFGGVELEIAERASVMERDIVKFRLMCQVTPDEPAN